MLNIAICDDTREDITKCSALISEYREKHPEIDIKFNSFDGAESMLFSLERDDKYDLFLLDILMPEMNGIDLGKKIRDRYPDASLVYMTTSEDYAVDAYSVYAFQYLVKPLTRVDFFKMLDTFIMMNDEQTSMSMAVKTAEGTETVFFNTISHLECRGHVIFFTLTNGRTITTSHIRVPFLTYAAPLLKDNRFISTHKSFVVNLDCVAKLSAADFRMLGGEIVPISRNNYTDVKHDYLDHISAKNSREV